MSFACHLTMLDRHGMLTMLDWHGMTILAGERGLRTFLPPSHATPTTTPHGFNSPGAVCLAILQIIQSSIVANTSSAILLLRLASVFHKWKVCKGRTYPDGDYSRCVAALGKSSTMAELLSRAVHFLLFTRMWRLDWSLSYVHSCQFGTYAINHGSKWRAESQNVSLEMIGIRYFFLYS
jgi:hypothetical protein